MPYLEQQTYGFVRNRKFPFVLPLPVVNAVANLAAKAMANLAAKAMANLEVKAMANLEESDEHAGERGGVTKPCSGAVSVGNGAVVSVRDGAT